MHMPVTLTIKNVADKVAEKLRLRAAANHRSLQGELTAILDAAVHQPSRAMEDEPPYVVSPAPSGRREKKLRAHGKRMTLAELWERSRQLGGKSKKGSAGIIRTLRDERFGR